MIAKLVGGVLGLLAVVGAILLVRDATLSIHEPVHPDSSVELVVRVSTNGNERGQTVDEITEAVLLACRLEVNSDVTTLEDLGDRRYRARLAPGMDDTDRRQFRGCLEDWTVDHVRLDVERLITIRPGS